MVEGGSTVLGNLKLHLQKKQFLLLSLRMALVKAAGII